MSNVSPLTTQQLDTLRRYDTPTVCNVIELFDIQPQTFGYMDGRIQSCFPEMPPMVGYAVTATFRSAAPSTLPDAYRMQVDQLKSFATVPSPPVVVFQDLDDPPRAATFGEMMCTTYQQFGAAGLISSGAGRDLDQVEALGFPVFTGGTICAHGYPQIVGLNVPVNVGGLTVFPGDLLHGDRNGITRIPAAIAVDVVSACQEFVDIEKILFDFYKDTDNPTIEQYDATLLKIIQQQTKLHQKLSRK